VALVLAEEEFPGRILPRELAEIDGAAMEIIWVSRNVRSYKKLVPSLLNYPGEVIVTADDDVLYRSGWLRGLYQSYLRSDRKTICGWRGSRIVFGVDGLRRYVEWPRADSRTPSKLLFLTGIGGILCPPDLLADELLISI
jgi:hypothetical protein